MSQSAIESGNLSQVVQLLSSFKFVLLLIVKCYTSNSDMKYYCWSNFVTAKQVEGAWDQNFREWHESTEQAKGKKWYDTFTKCRKGYQGLHQTYSLKKLTPWIYIHDFMRIQYCSNKFLPVNDIFIDKNETEWWKLSGS